MKIIIHREPHIRQKMKTPTLIQLSSAAFCIALLVSAALVAHAANTDPVAQVTGGQIKGRMIAGGGASFKGVPFAEPPLGDLRWRDAVPVQPWTGVRDAGRLWPHLHAGECRV